MNIGRIIRNNYQRKFHAGQVEADGSVVDLARFVSCAITVVVDGIVIIYTGKRRRDRSIDEQILGAGQRGSGWSCIRIGEVKVFSRIFEAEVTF